MEQIPISYMRKKIFFCLSLCFLVLLLHPMDALANHSVPLDFEKALNESRAGNFKEALGYWDNVIDLYPTNGVALSNRGNVRLALGDFDGAIVDQDRAIEMLPDEIDPHLNRGIAEEALKRWNEAIEDYEWVLTRDPDNASALYNLGNVKVSQGDWLQSKLLFNKATLVNPDFAIALSSKALANYQLNELDAAEEQLRALIKTYPMFADGRAALSALLWHKGVLGEAQSHWAAAFGLDNRYTEEDWLLNIRRWPPEPTKDLMEFLDKKSV
ncbi:tetratricopeptide repeat protein [Prochlorococcus marinus]|uniref:tetratricopeptide repeat protein n=1 Tax=Prochlorococcus marinus TaxID=1219 RepID=UPI0022B2D348|nr:tetratricopeptide repeat protein [Prochlorococcus marinus]